MTETTQSEGRIRVWDLPVRVFHWGLAVSFGAAYLVAESERLRQVHVMFGYTMLGLIAFRLLWGFVGTRYARFGSFLFGPRAVLNYLKGIATGTPTHYVGHNPAGSYAIYAILALGVLTGISGYCTLNEIGGDAVEELHEFAANTWLVVVFLHVAGVVISSIAHRENLVRAMITGYKRVSGSSAGALGSSPSRAVIGVLGAAAVLIFWVGSLLTGGPSVSGRGPDAAVAQEAEADQD